MREDMQIHYWIERVALFNDEAAFKELFLHYNGQLFNLAHSFVGSEQVAEEIISDSFMNLWRNRSRLIEIENLTVYLYVSVKNLSIRYLTRNKAKGHLVIDELLLANVPTSTQTPDQLMVSKEVVRTIENAIEDLPPKCKLIFKLVREDGLKYKEIAQILNISVKTIDAQMAIAGKRIMLAIRFQIPGKK